MRSMSQAKKPSSSGKSTRRGDPSAVALAEFEKLGDALVTIQTQGRSQAVRDAALTFIRNYVPADGVIVQKGKTVPFKRPSTSKRAAQQQPLTLKQELVLEAQIQTSGSHPFFHDMQRVEVLRRTSLKVASDPDLTRLWNLLSDAHERIAAIEVERDAWEDEKFEMGEKVANAETEQDAAENAAEELEAKLKEQAESLHSTEKRCQRLEKDVDQLTSEAGEVVELRKKLELHQRWLSDASVALEQVREVEPLATAFAVLASHGLVYDGQLPESAAVEQHEIIQHAVRLLTVGG